MLLLSFFFFLTVWGADRSSLNLQNRCVCFVLVTIILFALFLLFLRFLPCVNIAEVKWTLKESDAHDDDKKAHPDDGVKVIEAYQYEIHENPDGAAIEAGREVNLAGENA